MNDIERRIHRGMNQMAPDVFQNIMADAGEKLESEVWLVKEDHGQSRSFWMRAAQTAAVLAACCMLIFGVIVYQFSLKVDSVVEIDVNPSLELQMNRSDRVVRVNALNADGVKILDDLEKNLKHVKLEEAVQMLVDAMVTDGYLDQEKNSVLVSVDHENTEKSVELQMLVADNVKEALGQDEIEPVVYHQSYTLDSWIRDMSERYEISPGKAAFIKKLMIKRPDFDIEELARMSISEITELLEQEEVDVMEYTAKKPRPGKKTADQADGSEGRRLMAKAEENSFVRENSQKRIDPYVSCIQEKVFIDSAEVPEVEETMPQDGVIVGDKVTGGFQTGTDPDMDEPGDSDTNDSPEEILPPEEEESEQEEKPPVEEDPNAGGQLGSGDETNEDQQWENVEGIPTILLTQIREVTDGIDRLLICLSQFEELEKEIGRQQAYETCQRYLGHSKKACGQLYWMVEEISAQGELQQLSYEQLVRLMKQAEEKILYAEKCLASYEPEEECVVNNNEEIGPDGE